jgi:hypothetical protein
MAGLPKNNLLMLRQKSASGMTRILVSALVVSALENKKSLYEPADSHDDCGPEPNPQRDRCRPRKKKCHKSSS